MSKELEDKAYLYLRSTRKPFQDWQGVDISIAFKAGYNARNDEVTKLKHDLSIAVGALNTIGKKQHAEGKRRCVCEIIGRDREEMSQISPQVPASNEGEKS